MKLFTRQETAPESLYRSGVADERTLTQDAHFKISFGTVASVSRVVDAVRTEVVIASSIFHPEGTTYIRGGYFDL